MYRLRYQPDHPRADITGLVAEHILVAEKAWGPLGKGEIVHHKDFNKLNNAPTNLLHLPSRATHQRLPEYQARFILAKGLYAEFIQWWEAERLHDAENAHIREIERKLVKAENDRERLQKHASSK